jgi:glycosyltransferase involved in cell wall biosynthesis
MQTSLVAAIPALNCAATIATVVEGCLRHTGRVVVVDDGSTDDTAAHARAAGAEVESLERNHGKGFALRRALELALAGHDAAGAPAAVAMLDGDGQHDPDDLPVLIAAWRAGEGELVIGSRMGESETIPRARYWTNYIGSRVLSWMSGYELSDSQSGYRLASAELIRRWRLSSSGYAIESEMILKSAHLRARIAQVPIRTIYGAEQSYFHPVRDTFRISCEAIYFKVFDDR